MTNYATFQTAATNTVTETDNGNEQDSDGLVWGVLRMNASCLHIFA